MAGLTLIPILGNQLSFDLSALADADPAATIVLMAEAEDETTYVRHHRRKLAYILSAMRHHAEGLRQRGWTVEYVELDDPDNSGSFTGEVARACERHEVSRIVVTEAGEWRVQGMLESWQTLFGVPVEIHTDDRYIASHADFEEWAEGRRDLVMEFFYREQRVKTDLLMNGTKPEGGALEFRQGEPQACRGRPVRARAAAVRSGRDHVASDRHGRHPLPRPHRQPRRLGPRRHA